MGRFLPHLAGEDARLPQLAAEVARRVLGVEEPAGGAHSDTEAAIQAVGDAVEDELKAMAAMSPAELKKQRADRFYAIGRAGLQ